MSVKSPNMLASAKGQACIRCKVEDGTIVAAHYQGFRSQSLGKGTGKKPGDIFIAHLCHKCHNEFDSYQISTLEDPWLRKLDRSEQFMFWIMKTWERLHVQGKIIIKP